jgi:NAD(P)H-dependent FMN reductase
MAPPAVKNLFLLCDATFELADKPALLVGVSSGSGGAAPLSELRVSSYKNTRVCYIPEQVVVRDVQALFEDGCLVETPEAKRLEAQLVHALRLLVSYADALRLVRDSGVRDVVEFPWNMS